MRRLTLLWIALVLLLLVLPLVSLGATGGNNVLWWIGLILLAIGGLLPPLSRYVTGDKENRVL